jgi:iron only hydrogenase large subunit-like protein
VFDTFFSADLTIMEEGTELIECFGREQPMFTSCCPGWVQLVNSVYPQLKPFVSTSKSPQMMMGAMIKSYFAERVGVSYKDIYSVSVMPCVKKQSEVDRVGGIHISEGIKDVDLVVTTQDVIGVFKDMGVDPSELPETEFDHPMGTGSGGGAIFGRTGGVMEAALRFAYASLTSGEVMPELVWTPMKELPGVKECTIEIESKGAHHVLRVAVVLGLADAKKYTQGFLDGAWRHDFVEVMGCVPGGCISGGGQPPVGKNKELMEARRKAMNTFDNGQGAHNNVWIHKLYDEYLGEPMGEKAHHLLHTPHDKDEGDESHQDAA